MAAIRKRGDSWRVELYKNGQRESATFATKQEAATWALQREAELTGKRVPSHTLHDALLRYGREVAPKHKGERWEVLRCNALAELPLASKKLTAITSEDLSSRRDERLSKVSPGTVRREMVLLRSVFDVAIREWGWLRINPMQHVRKPPAPASRRRRIDKSEVEAVTLALGYDGGVPETTSQRIALAFEFALETAMRSGEITGLVWGRVKEKFVTLPETKNGDRRDIPLSMRAREILALLRPEKTPGESDSVFNLDPAIRDALWRKARDKTQIADLHFHDSRAEAIWRLSKKLDLLELARVIGHRDLRSLNFYYATSADELADRLG